MLMRWESDTRTAAVEAEALAAFARSRPGAPHGFCRSHGGTSPEPGQRRDVSVSCVRREEGFSVRVSGTVNAAARDGDTLVCEMYRAVRRHPGGIDPGGEPVFLACAMLCAGMLAEEEDVDSVVLRIVFTRERDGEARAWEGHFARALLRRAFDALYARALPFLHLAVERESAGREALSRLRFPYPAVREGQRELMETLFSCVRRRRPLLVGAPTGIGKTMSVLYPSLRALGAGAADRIFYFTAKTVTGNAAMEAVRLLRTQGGTLRCIRLSAKERLCPLRPGREEERDLCRGCPRLAAQGEISYEARRDAALLELLEKYPLADADALGEIAEKYAVCPYELSLDVSEYCDVILCDYGYLIDPHVRLQRYFVQKREEKYIFLLDEAHNLPDRARAVYSAALERSVLTPLGETLCAALPDDRPLGEAWDRMRAALDGLDALCAEEAEDTGEGLAGSRLLPQPPEFLTEAVGRLRAAAEQLLRRGGAEAPPEAEELRGLLRRFADAVGWADEGFACYLESVSGETSARLMCLDPSRLLAALWARAETTVLFSATLAPMEYYADVCGCPDAAKLELPSPYERENLCLVAVDAVNTRLSLRKSTAGELAEWIAAVTESRAGNYIVYFPSYRYMTDVCREYRRAAPDAHVILQKQSMSLAERDRFLREFGRCARQGESVVAFCVLGGIFAEGIDLRGEALIGTVIVGIGLPGLSSELNILAEYYDKTRERGHDYAYLYPAINKILQAAGRVIRGERDRGVVVLIDDRYADPGVRGLFPAHWGRMQYTADPYTLGVILDRFWQETDAAHSEEEER